MSESPLVSVVMPAYNAERYVEEAISSVVGQSYRNLELIVIDDASTDGTRAIIERFMGEDHRIALIQNEVNSGVAVSRNKGIEAASGEWIALIDSDDSWENEKIQKQLRSLLKHNGDISYCSYYMDTFDDNESLISRKVFQIEPRVTFESMLAVNSFSCSTVMIRASILKSNPFSLNYYHEDYALWMRLLQAGSDAVGLVEPLASYRLHAGSRSSNKFQAARERWTIYRKGLGLSLPQSICSFWRYALFGIRKYGRQSKDARSVHEL